MPHDPAYARQALGDPAPKLAEPTDDPVSGGPWTRPGLTPRERSLVTVPALMALSHTGQLPFHLRRAPGSGIDREQRVEPVTRLASYGGWPVASSALSVLRELDPTGA